MRVRYAQVGVGSRSMMYTRAIVERYAGNCELVGLCDTNPGRLALRQSWARERGVAVPTYAAADFVAWSPSAVRCRHCDVSRRDTMIISARRWRWAATSSPKSR